MVVHEALKFMAEKALFRANSPVGFTARTMFRQSNSTACFVRLARSRPLRSGAELKWIARRMNVQFPFSQ